MFCSDQEHETNFPDGRPHWRSTTDHPHLVASLCTGSAMDALALEMVGDCLREHSILQSGFKIQFTCEMDERKAGWIADVHNRIIGESCCNFTELKECLQHIANLIDIFRQVAILDVGVLCKQCHVGLDDRETEMLLL